MVNLFANLVCSWPVTIVVIERLLGLIILGGSVIPYCCFVGWRSVVGIVKERAWCLRCTFSDWVIWSFLKLTSPLSR